MTDVNPDQDNDDIDDDDDDILSSSSIQIPKRMSTFEIIKKIGNKALEQPLVIGGLVFTLSCLGFGIAAFRKGNKERSRLMMKGRIFGQGFTILSAMYYLYQKTPPSSFEGRRDDSNIGEVSEESTKKDE